MNKVHSRAQAWSIDLIIAVVIFVLVITIFYTLLVREPHTDIKALQRETKTIADKLSDQNSPSPCAFLKGKEINTAKMKQCYFEYTPKRFKEENNLENNFCIFLVDQNGRVVSVNNMTGFGDPDLNVSGTRCGQVIQANP